MSREKTASTMPTHTTVSLYLDGPTKEHLVEMLNSPKFIKANGLNSRSRSGLIQFLIQKGYENEFLKIKNASK